MTYDNAFCIELFEQAQSGNARAMEAFLEPYVPFVQSLSRRFFCTELSSQDFYQAGYMGLIQAVQRYDPQRSVRFLTYAVPWILGEMRKALRHAADSTGAMQRSREITRTIQKLSVKLGREPQLDEAAEACQIPASEMIRTLEAANFPQSLDGQPPNGKQTLFETLSGTQEIDLDALDMRMALSELPSQEREAIVLRYYRDYTQKETAKIMGMSQTKISRLENKALDFLRRRLSLN